MRTNKPSNINLWQLPLPWQSFSCSFWVLWMLRCHQGRQWCTFLAVWWGSQLQAPQGIYAWLVMASHCLRTLKWWWFIYLSLLHSNPSWKLAQKEWPQQVSNFPCFRIPPHIQSLLSLHSSILLNNFTESSFNTVSLNLAHIYLLYIHSFLLQTCFTHSNIPQSTPLNITYILKLSSSYTLPLLSPSHLDKPHAPLTQLHWSAFIPLDCLPCNKKNITYCPFNLTKDKGKSRNSPILT